MFNNWKVTSEFSLKPARTKSYQSLLYYYSNINHNFGKLVRLIPGPLAERDPWMLNTMHAPIVWISSTYSSIHPSTHSAIHVNWVLIVYNILLRCLRFSQETGEIWSLLSRGLYISWTEKQAFLLSNDTHFLELLPNLSGWLTLRKFIRHVNSGSK